MLARFFVIVTAAGVPSISQNDDFELFQPADRYEFASLQHGSTIQTAPILKAKSE
jgi:hypothetical protein